jgi:Flp pilus assembly protein TadG
MRYIRHQLAGERGAEIAEAALVLPIAFMFLLGIVWFGRAFNVYSTITQAAQQGAVAAARGSCVTCGNTFASDAAVDNVIYSVMQSSNLDTSQIATNAKFPSQVPCPSPPAPAGGCTTTNNITVCRSVVLNPSKEQDEPQPTQCGVLVTFQYPFQFYLPFTSLNMQRIVLTAQSQSRMEN